MTMNTKTSLNHFDRIYIIGGLHITIHPCTCNSNSTSLSHFYVIYCHSDSSGFTYPGGRYASSRDDIDISCKSSHDLQ